MCLSNYMYSLIGGDTKFSKVVQQLSLQMVIVHLWSMSQLYINILKIIIINILLSITFKIQRSILKNYWCRNMGVRKHIYHFVFGSLLVFYFQVKLLEESHPSKMTCLLKLGSWLEVLQGLVIYVNDGLLANQIVLLLLHAFNQGIQLLVIRGIVHNNLGECLIMVTHNFPLLYQYWSHGISIGIYLNLKRMFGVT